MLLRDVSGHRSVLDLLARALARDTLPPTLLFVGSDGVGKRRVALALAQAINCQSATPAKKGKGGQPLTACGTCESCQRIERGVHGDVLLVEPGDSGAIKVDQVRDVIDRASYRPFEGRRRVVIIDEADLLVPEAQNALLKTLEEPPGASVFVLVSSRPDVLLATVRSRCPRLRFGRLTAAEVTETLVRDHGYTEADARAAAASADGSIGRALGADSTSVAQAREVASRALQTATASADPKRRMECAKDLIAKNKKKGAPAADREALALRLRAMTSLLRDVGLVLSGGNDAGLANADLGSEVMKLADRYDGDRIVRAFSAVDRALGALTVRNASPKVVADWLVLQL
ncbi:MAG: DNA polymerase III subunit delta' [Vicinamibacterales bacterium]|jgi:DNA polymerase-3 subunit delta'|nr:DNA polymerase III subunit delta' [Acidobacteriota bacterium]MDP7294547.1 DNA polymerase III subunit delta' [Vicinamibacterales bacterium]|tara:strand:- start:1968 stop:3005 length:1038 start_codon:yes stop_codon:yes gene_type:complete